MTQRRAWLVAAGLAPWLAGRVNAQALVRSPAAPQVTSMREVPPGYFGGHLHRLVVRPDGSERATAWPDDTLDSLRLWDSGTGWADLAPSPGVWTFDRMDAYVAEAQRRRASVLCTFGITPRWASMRPDEPGPYGPGSAAPPVKIAHWEEYVARVAERYRGRIDAYELWNEPLFADDPADRGQRGFFSGDVAQMVELARSARRVLDRADPNAVLATPGFVNGPRRLEMFLRGGGAAFVDVVAYHFYARDAAQFIEQVADVAAVMRRCGVEKLPLWNTECGVEVDTAQRETELDAAARMAQLLVLGAALRLERFFYYAWDNYRSGMVDRQGVATPRLAAFGRVRGWLHRARIGAVEPIGARASSVIGVRGAEHFMLAWSESARAARVALPPGWRIASCETLMRAAPPAWPLAAGDASRVALSPAPVRLGLARA